MEPLSLVEGKITCGGAARLELALLAAKLDVRNRRHHEETKHTKNTETRTNSSEPKGDNPKLGLLRS